MKPFKRFALITTLLAASGLSMAQVTTAKDAASVGTMPMAAPTPGTGNLPVPNADATRATPAATERAMKRKQKKATKAEKMTAEHSTPGMSGMSGTAGSSSAPTSAAGSNAATVNPSAANPNDVHAMPAPASQSSQQYKGK